MDVDVDLYLAARLLFKVQALIFASVFERLCGAEGGRPREPPAAEKARGTGAGDQEAGKWETAEKPNPAAPERRGGAAADLSPAAAESIPQQPASEPREPEPQEDAGDHAALPSKAEEEDVDSDKEQLVVREPASTAATPAPVTSTAASFESSEGFEWPLGTLETCLLILIHVDNDDLYNNKRMTIS
ncbi:hypothetical protein AAES_144650 [Amazona aestiva]|uniref:Uncharacterized protein n=1 Tax=Amazona aestiva TaxID=12930 RepID=A0A0Q3LYC4_AMAAE|nr:hypothetical protein AAES_144650 [Amazona aestiva]